MLARRQFWLLIISVSVLGGTSANAQERALAVQWEGIQGLVAGLIAPEPDGRQRLRIQLAGMDRECVGTLSVPKGATEGSWAIACPSGLAATGTYTPSKGGAGNGSGADTSGRKVTFVVGPILAAPPAPTAGPTATASKPPITAEQLNQQELERKHAERHKELLDATRRNHEEAEAARAAQSKTPPTLTTPTKTFASAEEVTSWAYSSIVDRVSAQKVGDAVGVAQSRVGKTSDYRGIGGGKVLAVCIDWGRSNAGQVFYNGWQAMYQDASAPRMSDLREEAMSRCARSERNGCRCQVVDESGRSTLKVPDDFIRKVIAPKSSAAPPPPLAPAPNAAAGERKVAGNATAKEKRHCNYGANPLAWPFQWQLCSLFQPSDAPPQQSAGPAAAPLAPTEPAAAPTPHEPKPTPMLDRLMSLVVPNMAVLGPARQPTPPPPLHATAAAPPKIEPGVDNTTSIPPAPIYDRQLPATMLQPPRSQSAPSSRDLGEPTR